MIAKCVDACLECSKICDDCSFNCCIGKENHKQTLKNTLFCAEVCRLCAQACVEGGRISEKMRSFCSEICELCASECDKNKDEKCEVCAKICRKCAKECRAG